MENKKGVLGLDTVKLVMIAFLILAVIGVALILTGVSLRDVADVVDISSGSTNAETGLCINASGCTLDFGYLRNFVPSVTAYNYTDGTEITAGNYTVSSVGLITNATAAVYHNVTANYTYTYSGNSTSEIVLNLGEGVEGFFSNTATIFAILVVVIIILAISIIIAAVSRFGGREGGI